MAKNQRKVIDDLIRYIGRFSQPFEQALSEAGAKQPVYHLENYYKWIDSVMFAGAPLMCLEPIQDALEQQEITRATAEFQQFRGKLESLILGYLDWIDTRISKAEADQYPDFLNEVEQIRAILGEEVVEGTKRHVPPDRELTHYQSIHPSNLEEVRKKLLKINIRLGELSTDYTKLKTKPHYDDLSLLLRDISFKRGTNGILESAVDVKGLPVLMVTTMGSTAQENVLVVYVDGQACPVKMRDPLTRYREAPADWEIMEGIFQAHERLPPRVLDSPYTFAYGETELFFRLATRYKLFGQEVAGIIQWVHEVLFPEYNLNNYVPLKTQPHYPNLAELTRELHPYKSNRVVADSVVDIGGFPVLKVTTIGSTAQEKVLIIYVDKKARPDKMNNPLQRYQENPTDWVIGESKLPEGVLGLPYTFASGDDELFFRLATTDTLTGRRVADVTRWVYETLFPQFIDMEPLPATPAPALAAPPIAPAPAQQAAVNQY